MLKRIKWKAVLFVFLWTISLGGLGVLMGFISIKKDAAVCKEVRVILPGNQFFIEKAEVDEILASKNGLLIGRKLNLINLQNLEDRLQANPFIEYANVFADMDGVIHANIKQRVPVLRVLNVAGQDFYIDKNGLKIPTSSHFTARVLAANGQILEGFGGKVDTLRTQLTKDLYKIAVFVAADSVWDAQIEQIYVNENKEIELIPRVGNQKIIFGDAEDLEDKFERLMIFYSKAIPQVGWDAYSSINLKFKGQVVCQRSDSTIIRLERIEKSRRDSIRKAEALKHHQDTI